MMKRFIALTLLLAVALSAMPAPGMAETEARYGYLVIPNTLKNRVVNFRRQANTNDNSNYPIARLPEYWVVQVVGEKTAGGVKWYQATANINTDGNGAANYQSGYLMASFVTLMSEAEVAQWRASGKNTYQPASAVPTAPTQAPAGPTAAPAPSGALGYLRTVQPGVNMRETPGGAVINENDQIPLNVVTPYYSVIAFDEYDWALIQYNGKSGYIRSDCYMKCDASGNAIDPFATQAPATAAPAPTAEPAVVPGVSYGRVTMDDVFFRQSMSTAGSYWAKLPLGWTLTVLDKTVKNGVTWYKVRGGIPSNPTRTYTGYIHGDYFTVISAEDQATPAPTQAPAASSYGLILIDGINLRQTPGGATVAPLRSNVVVNVLYTPSGNTANDWYYVEINGLYGYLPATSLRVLNTWELGNYVLPGQPVVTAAPTQAPATVTTGYIKLIKNKVNLRKTPAGTVLTAADKTKLLVGTVLAYTEITEKIAGYNWALVTVNGMTGYVRSDCYQYTDAEGKPVVTPAPTAAPVITAYPGVATPDPTDTPASSQGYIKLIKGGVNLRQTPGGSVITRLNRGTVLPFFNIVRTASSETWYEVYSAQHGAFGYILSTMAQVTNEQGQQPLPTIAPTSQPVTAVGYVATTASSVWLRRTPQAGSDTNGQIKTKGTVLPLIGVPVYTDYTWYPVETSDGRRGYLRGDFVFELADWQLEIYKNTGKAPTPTPGPATPRPGNSSYLITTSDKLWVRETPSKQAGTLGQLSKNTVLYFKKTQVVGKGTANEVTWYQITYGSKTGWLHGGYVRVLTNAEYDAWKGTAVPVITPTPGATLAPGASPTAPAEATYRTLRKNSSGEDVLRVQQRLAELGYLAESQVNGVYLSSTENAVIAYQRAHNLTVDGIAGPKTQHSLFGTVETGTYTDGSSVTVNLYPVEKSDWYTGDIQKVWSVGSVAIITDVYTGISFQAQRLYGNNHADCEPLTTADTAAICRIYGVTSSQEIEDREQELQSYRRRPLWVTIGGRTFCGSMYGIPHNYSGDRIPDNGYTGQFCVHFTNSRTHTTNIVDPDASYNNYFGHQSAIQYAYTHSISGTK